MRQYALDTDSDNYLKEYKKFLALRKGYINNLSSISEIEIAINRLVVRDYEIVISKEMVLDFLLYLKNNKCFAAKICFGMDKSVENGGQIQLVNSGSFWEVRRKNSAKTNYTKTLDNIYKINGETEFRLNFGNKRVDKVLIKSNFENFKNLITNDEPNVSMGYVIGVKNFTSIFTKSNFLGRATQIKFEFGMNSSGIGDIQGSQFMMIKISSQEVPNKAYWLFDTDIVDNDSMGCPPRPPCES
jgi:hypothetical protein